MIDEYPVLFVAAALATGRSTIRGIEELRVKESDRIATMAQGLRAIGVQVEELPDGIVIDGRGGAAFDGLADGAARIASKLDHRIAMSFAVAGLHAAGAITIDDMSPIATSFPGFVAALRALGADVACG